MKFKHLTKKNIKWLFGEAKDMQGCLPPDERDDNRKLQEMEKEFAEAMELVEAEDLRDLKAINLVPQAERAQDHVMTEPKRVPVPLFEPMGPPCPVEGCKGVLWQYMSFKTGQSWQQCTECGTKVDEMPIQERMDKAVAVITAAFERSLLDNDP